MGRSAAARAPRRIITPITGYRALTDNGKARGPAYLPAAGLSAAGLLSAAATATGSCDTTVGLADTGAVNMSG